MKLRIKGNSIRLRLTQSEVDEIGHGNMVSESVSFGIQSPTFHYALKPDEHTSKICAQYVDHSLQILIPLTQAKEWANTDLVGLENDISIGEEKSIYILVEKDFQCLHKRPREDERDNFPNPEAKNA